MYVRKPSKALTHLEVKALSEAVHFADKRGKRLPATLSINPALLESYPSDLHQWRTTFLNKLRGFREPGATQARVRSRHGPAIHCLRLAAEGAVDAYQQVISEAWKPVERAETGPSVDRQDAASKMAAFG